MSGRQSRRSWHVSAHSSESGQTKSRKAADEILVVIRVHQIFELGLVGRFQLEQPAVVKRGFVDALWRVSKRFVDFDHPPGNRTLNFGGRFNRFDHHRVLALLDVAADIR